MKAPVLFLTFANDPDSHLALLKRERKNITRSLRELDDKNQVKVVTESGTTIEDIFEVFHAYEDQVTIFHFGGHAGGTHLRLENDGSGTTNAQATGLSEFLGQQTALRLVFLNGCATGPQVSLLLKNGVKVIIATSSKIEDQMATEFAEQFYYALANHASIQKSFDTATSFIRAKYASHSEIEVHRGLSIWGANEDKSSDLPWGLFVADGADASLNWSIPQSSQIEKTIRGRMAYEDRLDVNDLLIDTICEDLALYSKDLDYELNKENLVIASIIREIVDCFPLPIGEQLRKLFTRSNNPSNPDDMELFTELRLEQIYQTHRATAQFIAFILLSQLWDAKHENPDLEIEEDHIVAFNSFFAMSEDNFREFDYFTLSKSITDIFDEHNIPYFLEELRQIKINSEPNGALSTSINFLEAVNKNLLGNQIEPAELQNICLQAEEALGQVLKTVAFLAKYKLATIKNIEIIKRRHEEANYRHNHIELNRAITIAGTKITEIGEVFSNFTDNKSVLFLKTRENKISAYLSLSPFVIDLNALDNEHSSKLYLFSFQRQNDYCYQFLNNYKDDLLTINDTFYKTVKDEFEKFKANIHGISFTSQSMKKSPGGSRFKRKRQ
jgi:CHAT domain-containing protein